MFDAESLINYGGLLFLFLPVYGQIGLFFCFSFPAEDVCFWQDDRSFSKEQDIIIIIVAVVTIPVVIRIIREFQKKNEGPQ